MLADVVFAPLREIGALLEPYGVKCVSAGALGLPEPAETGTTFVQNALIKARALDKLSDQFVEWMNEEVAKLVEAWASYEQTPNTKQTKFELHRRAHDLKGLAPTYGYPLVGRICASLCKLTGDEHGDINAPITLLKAHVDAVKAAAAGIGFILASSDGRAVISPARWRSMNRRKSTGGLVDP